MWTFDKILLAILFAKLDYFQFELQITYVFHSQYKVYPRLFIRRSMQTKHHSIISTADMLKCCLFNYSDNNSLMRNTVNSYIKSPLRKTTIECYQADKNGSGF